MMSTALAYLHERFRPGIFGPAIALQAGLALWISRPPLTARVCLQAFVTIALLLLQFRLWDDLEDRDRDRVAHPERLLVRHSPTPFWRVLAGLALANLALVGLLSITAAAGLALLDLACWAAYRKIRARVSDPTWRFRLLPDKYPAFVWITAATVGTPATGRLFPGLLFMWACACSYEALHDRPAASRVTP